MAKGSERMRQMKENFMKLHEEGYTIPEIAQKFELSPSSIYKSLQEIADANEVSRSSLLQHEKAPSERTILREEEKKAKVSVEDLRKGFKDTRDMIEVLIEVIGEALESEKEEENSNDN